jgi:hypothetical protein
MQIHQLVPCIMQPIFLIYNCLPSLPPANYSTAVPTSRGGFLKPSAIKPPLYDSRNLIPGTAQVQEN